MRVSLTMAFIPSIFLFAGCAKHQDDINADLPFEKHIKFNHLYVVLDDSTYRLLSTSVPLVASFARFKEEKTDAGPEVWSGKYLSGKNHYLEIFKPEGYEGAKLGDFGMAFMPNKLGTLDSLYKYWLTRPDSIDRRERNYVEDGVTYPWFTAISVVTKDTLKVNVWLMENRKEDMLYYGFSDDDLEKEIEYRDYVRFSRAKSAHVPPDSVQYDKLFEKVNKIHLRLSARELEVLRGTLKDFGFSEEDHLFRGNDIDVAYKVTAAEHFILDRIDFTLLRPVENQHIKLNRLTIDMSGTHATFQLNY